eukprot:4554292-Ditylum_brightwellii.AAC.1
MAETTTTWVGPANNQTNSHIHQERSPAAERAFNTLSVAGIRGHAVDCCVFYGLDLEACGIADTILICFVLCFVPCGDHSDQDLGGFPVSRIIGTFQRVPIGHGGDHFGPG